MAEIIWKNGQGEFDFDYLLNITSAEFVKKVSFVMDNRGFRGAKVNKLEFNDVDVLIIFDWGLYVFTFNYISKTIIYNSITYNDMKYAIDFVGLSGGVNYDV